MEDSIPLTAMVDSTIEVLDSEEGETLPSTEDDEVFTIEMG